MDIRRWLTSPKGTGNSAPPKPENNLKQSKSSAINKTSKKRRIVESDSDEEPLPNETKETQKNGKSPKKSSAQSKTAVKAGQEVKKPVSVSDFFGSGPIVRSEKAKDQKKSEKIKAESIHEDKDFEATLSQLNSKPLKDQNFEEEKRNKTFNTKETAKKTSANKKSKIDDSAKNEVSDKKKDISKVEELVEAQKAKRSPKDKSEGKTTSSKRKSKSDSIVKMEISPNDKKPDPKTVSKSVAEEKPAVKKHKGGANYASYLGREGPKALGSKEIPEGEEECLAGLTFIITGVLESIDRDEAKALIEKYGGKVMTTLSKNTKYIVIGRDAGASKLDKAEKLGTKQLDEDGLLDLIKTRPGKPGTRKIKKPESKASVDSVDFKKELGNIDMDVFADDDLMIMDEKESNEVSNQKESNEVSNQKESSEDSNKKKSVDKNKLETKSNVISEKKSSPVVKQTPEGFSMWVDKYKPGNIKQIIGQQGDKSNAKKLLNWLINWSKNRRLNKKPIPAGRWNAQDDGSGYKAALLSGPPGVGKTTTAQLVCNEAGYDYFELNASDTRSKRYLQEAVSQLLGNQVLADCFKESSSGKVSNKHVIVMDEVDGMSGNEDRGGMRELIDFIKASKVPIVCICNDRNHPKIRSLANHCFDLRFQRPRVEQIKAAMMSIAFKEGVKVAPTALQDVIVASNQDIRQVLHNMSMWSANAKGLTEEQTKRDVGKGTKHIKMGPFDVLREVFAIGNNPKATIYDKSDLFFHDYSLAPLFVQENYIHVIPSASEGNKIKHLTLLSEAADSICIGDVIDRQIRNQMSWSLLPTQAIFASVVPGELLRGHLRQMINFPMWFGKNSNQKHMDRVLQELHIHMRMRITGNKTDVALEYLPLLKRALTKPLIEKEQEGVNEVLSTMEEYYLLREDFDSIIDLSIWPSQTDPRTKISPKVKSAFTRAYNKESGKNPYAIKNVKKKKGAAKDFESELVDSEDKYVSEDEEDDDKLENDAMIKVKKPPKKAAGKEQSEPSTSKAKKNLPKKGKGK